MAFPSSPTTGQIATVNGINYIYSSTEMSWTRTPAATVSVGNLIANGNITTNLGVYSNSGYYWSNGAPYGSAAFSNIAATGQPSALANTASSTLNVSASGGLRVLIDPASDTLHITATIDTSDYGFVNNVVTDTANLGVVTDLPTISNIAEYGNVAAFLVGTINGATIWGNSIPGSRLVPGTDVNVGGVRANTITASNVITGNITTGNLAVSGVFSANLSLANISLGSNLTLTGNAARIIGDFSNATPTNRVFFQTSATNSPTNLGVIPSGTGVSTTLLAYNNSDPTNASRARIGVNSSEVQIQSDTVGTGTYLPMAFYTSGLSRMTLDTAGNLTLLQSAAINGLATIAGNVAMLSNVTISKALGVGTSFAGNTGEIRATNYITAFYSDKRLKSNIEPITGALDKIKQLAGVIYTQNELAEQYGYTDYSQQVGVFAQDVQRVLPQAVKPAPFDIGPGGTSISGQNYLTVQYEKLVPLLVEAIKELSDLVDQLKGQ